jgi:tRNA A37 threonylcarbamoyladenosine dehydratase
METMFDRSVLVIGEDQLDKLRNSHIMIFGLGGVGGYVCEMLSRAGIGEMTIVDYDTVDRTNLNRQIIALESTIGLMKTSLFESRLKDINPEIRVNIISRRLEPGNIEEFFNNQVDYVVDAIDQVSSKLALIEFCTLHKIPIISSMGTGNKIDPKQVEVADIYKTDMDPMAKIMRKELKKREIPSLKVVFSREKPIRNAVEYEKIPDARKPGSLVFVPATAGIVLASEVVNDILKSQLL